jgi:hypothetical protein
MGSGLTPTQSWPYPLETDTPDVAADMHALALALDVVPKRLSGLASARPTASTIPVGTFFFATDTGILSFCTGAAWIAIEPNLTLVQGLASAIPAAGSPPRIYYATDTEQYSVDNGTVWLPVMMTSRTVSGNTTALSGEEIFGTANLTVTLPVPTVGARVKVVSLAAAGIAVASHGGANNISGPGQSAVSGIYLTLNAYAEFTSYDGVNWEITAGQQDTGWVALTRGGGVTAGAGYTPAARLRGDTAELCGQLTGSGITAWATGLPIPASQANLGGVNGITVSTGGALTTSSAGSILSLDALSYRIS